MSKPNNEIKETFTDDDVIKGLQDLQILNDEEWIKQWQKDFDNKFGWGYKINNKNDIKISEVKDFISNLITKTKQEAIEEFMDSEEYKKLEEDAWKYNDLN